MFLLSLCAVNLFSFIFTLSCLFELGAAEEPLSQLRTTFELSPAVAKLNVSGTEETHCFTQSSGNTFGILDNRACSATINWMMQLDKSIHLQSDVGIAGKWKLEGLNCRIEVFGGSKDMMVRVYTLARIAAHIIHVTCKPSGRGGVTPFGDDQFFLSIWSSPFPNVGLNVNASTNTFPTPSSTDVADVVRNSSTTLRKGNPIRDITTCYRRNYPEINQPACRKLIRELLRDSSRRTVRPRFRKVWEEGLGECDIVLVGGPTYESFSSREVANIALAIVRDCTISGRGGETLIGQKGSTVEIFTILQDVTSGPPRIEGDTIYNTSAPVPQLGSGSETTG